MAASRAIRLGPYELVEQIAQGAYGEIYRAKHVGPAGFQRILAIKRLKRHVMADPDAVRAFENEARIGGLLLHHNIAQTLEFNQHEGHYYLAMEFVDGVSFQDIITVHASQGKEVPEPIALELAAQACDGLHYAHEARTPEGVPLNLVHRDIKPSNLMLTRSGVVKVMDFGIARVDNQTLTDAGFIKGTPRYLSPEVITGGDNIDRRSDLFSLGTVLYELLALEYLFDAPNLLTLMSKVRGADVKKQLKALSKRYPGTAKLLSRVLTSEPDKRFSTAREMARELRHLKRRLSRDDVDLEAFAVDIFEAQARVAAKSKTPQEVAEDKAPVEPAQAVDTGPRADMTGFQQAPASRSGTAEESPPQAQQPPPANIRRTPRFGSRSLADRPPVLPDVKLKTTSITVDQLMDGWGKPSPKPAKVDLRQTDPGPIGHAQGPRPLTPDQPPVVPPGPEGEATSGLQSERTETSSQSAELDQNALDAAMSLLPDGLPAEQQATPSPIPADRVTSLMGQPQHAVAHPPSVPVSSSAPLSEPSDVLPGPARPSTEQDHWIPDDIPTHTIDLHAMNRREGAKPSPKQTAGPQPAQPRHGQPSSLSDHTELADESAQPDQRQQEAPNLARLAHAGGETRSEEEAPLQRGRPDLLKTRVSTTIDDWNPDLEDLESLSYRDEEISATAALPDKVPREPNPLGFGMAATILSDTEETDSSIEPMSPTNGRKNGDASHEGQKASTSGTTPGGQGHVSPKDVSPEVATEVMDLRKAPPQPVVGLHAPSAQAKQPAALPSFPSTTHSDREPTTARIVHPSAGKKPDGPDANGSVRPGSVSGTHLVRTQNREEEPTEPATTPLRAGQRARPSAVETGNRAGPATRRPAPGTGSTIGHPEERPAASNRPLREDDSRTGDRVNGAAPEGLPVFEPTAAVPDDLPAFEPTAAVPADRVAVSDEEFGFEPTAALPLGQSGAPAAHEVLEPTSFRPVRPNPTGREDPLEATSFRPAPGVDTEEPIEATAAVAPRSETAGMAPPGSPVVPQGNPQVDQAQKTPPEPPGQSPTDPQGTPSKDVLPSDPLAELPKRSAELPTQVLDVSGPGPVPMPGQRPISSLEPTSSSPQQQAAEIGLRFDPEHDVEIWHRRILWAGGILILVLVMVILFALAKC